MFDGHGDMSQMSNVAFSRTGRSSPLGKCTAVLQTKVPEEVAEALKRRAVDAGYGSVSEFLRDWICVEILGHEHYAKLLAQRLRVALGKDSE